MTPKAVRSTVGTAEVWRHYTREDIPPLFGLAFNTAIWQQRFVATEHHSFLLVSCEKSGPNDEYQYQDHFTSSDCFHWQSQNRTRQEIRHGKLIDTGTTADARVHLFIRQHGKLQGKAAPFVYCGLVDFLSWEKEKPISVTRKLREEVQETMRSALGGPPESDRSREHNAPA